jgi:hypothetical protein
MDPVLPWIAFPLFRRQSRPDSILGYQVKIFKIVKDVPFSLGSGSCGEGASDVSPPWR